MEEKKKKRTRLGYPLYNVCYKMKDGEDKVVAENVTLQQGIAFQRRFDNVLVSSRAMLKDVLYCFMLPLLDKKPRFDLESGNLVYD